MTITDENSNTFGLNVYYSVYTGWCIPGSQGMDTVTIGENKIWIILKWLPIC